MSYPRTLVGIFAGTVRDFADNVAIDAETGPLAYADVAALVARLAAELAAGGVGPGDYVGVRVPSGSADLYVAVLGVLHAGAAYVPVDFDDPDDRADYVFATANVCAVIGESLNIEWRGEGGGVTRPLTPGDDAWVIFTSGSTGHPKGVAVTHASAAAFVHAETELLRVEPTDRVLAGLSVGFDASCEEMWLAWRNGAALVPVPRVVVRSGADLGRWLSERAVTVVSTVPTLAAMWDEPDLTNVRLLILGGEACSDELGWRLAAQREVWNTYGPTEATVVTTASRVVWGQHVRIGKPLLGWQVAVVDEDGLPVAAGDVGELVIGGIGLARYLDPQLDAQRFGPSPSLGWTRAYRSGDMVRLVGDELAFVGRRDDQVKIGGRRIEPGEVQAELAAVAGVRAAVVVVRHTEAGDPVLVAYMVADTGAAEVRQRLRARLPEAMMPIVHRLESMPLLSSGKVDVAALPWPLVGADASPLTGTAAWLADCWQRFLGVRPASLEADFFDLGGTSTIAAKLTSELRERYPAAAVADIYRHRTLGEISARLDQLRDAEHATASSTPDRRDRHDAVRRFGTWQLLAMFVLFVLQTPSWLVGIFGFDLVTNTGPRIPWPAVAGLWLCLVSPPGRLLIAALARRILLPDLRPGRYPRRGWFASRVWLVDRIGDVMHIAAFGGTPMAPFVARMTGTRSGPGAALGVIPSAASLVTIEAGATIEADADVHGWWIDGPDLVIDTITIGTGARVGSRALLMPGASVGDHAEIEPGSLVTGCVPSGQRWSGTPASYVGTSGHGWPAAAAVPSGRRAWRLVYGVSLAAVGLPAMLAALPGLLLAYHLGVVGNVNGGALLISAVIVAASWVVLYAALVALIVRALGHWVRPGWHRGGATPWALWLREQFLAGSRGGLFPLYCSLFTRPWLRLMGVQIGRRTEICTAVGLGPLVTFGAESFIADDVVFNAGRAHRGWLQLAPITVENAVFIGNGALISGGTNLSGGSLVGVQTTPPPDVPGDTSWFGFPALEFPRVRAEHDNRRTTDPSARLVACRAGMDLIRIMLPTSVGALLGLLVFDGIRMFARSYGFFGAAAVAPALLVAAGVAAVVVTALVKWLLIGKYRPGNHPLWSWFVWRDEIVNSCQELLAGAWLLDTALGTPLMSPYLRLMGTRVGKDVWCDTLTISEFDVVSLGSGCAVNRRACVESHLFHDRVMQIGAIHIGSGSTIGPSSAVLPETALGERSRLGGRSVVLRGERLPAATSWHGSPIVAE